MYGRRSERSVGQVESVRRPRSGRSSGTAAGESGTWAKRLEGLEAREEVVDLPKGSKSVAAAGAWIGFRGPTEAQVVELETQVWRRVINSRRYHPSCDCGKSCRAVA